MTPEEYRKMRNRCSSQNKYHNKKVVNKYGSFDSTHEFNVYLTLLDWRAKGIIEELHRQVKFELIPKATEIIQVVKHLKRGDKTVEKEITIEEDCCYIADFTYVENGKMVVVDAKSDFTRKLKDYIIKRKLMLWRYGHRIKEM